MRARRCEKLIVDFIDSKLNANMARNAIISACSQDLALVGTAAFFLTNFDDAINCKDQAGAPTGLPDVGAIVGKAEGCASISYPVNPPQVLCNTAAKTPQTYQANQMAFTYLLGQHKGDLHGSMLYGNDTQDSARSSTIIFDAATKAGVKSDQTVGVSSRAPQSAYTPIVQKMKQDVSNFALRNMLVQFTEGKFVRVHPSKKGTFDCKASNHVEFQADLDNG